MFRLSRKPDGLCIDDTESKSTPAGDVNVLHWLLHYFLGEVCDQHITNQANFVKNVNTDNNMC